MRRLGALLGLATLILAACTAPRRVPDSAPPAPAARTPQTAQASTPQARPATPPPRPGRGAYYQDDGPGENPPPNLEATPDAVPVDEPQLRSGANRAYVVFGKTYVPISGNGDFRQRGVGSWYGRKFHGQKTSSGEPYDMYAMTAAHPTLPLPSFVRVSNPANGRAVVVRVNDRGPFHSERIIDLSYTAALKLGYVNQGSALLEVERVRAGDGGPRAPVETAARPSAQPQVGPPRATATRPTERDAGSAPVAAAAAQPSIAPATAQPSNAPAAAQPSNTPATAQPSNTPAAAQPSNTPAAAETAVLATSTQPDGIYLQLGAFGAREGAEEFRIKTYQQLPWLNETILIVSRDRLHRVQLGPFSDRANAQATADRIRDALQLKPVFVLR